MLKIAYRSMKIKDESGENPMYRSKQWKKGNKIEYKDKIKWWNKKTKTKFKSVLFVPPTPGGELCKRMQQIEQSLNCNGSSRIKILEKGGIKVKNLVCKSNPYKPNPCEKPLCPVCHKGKYTTLEEGGPSIDCRTNNVGYRFECENCKSCNKYSSYEGETARSIKTRAIEHVNDMIKMKVINPIVKHTKGNHPGCKPSFKLKVTGVFHDALTRQADEASRIQMCKPSEVINNKAEFNHPPLDRLTFRQSGS